MWQFPPIQHLQVIAILPEIMGDFVWSFPSWTKLPLSWVLGGKCDFAQDEVSNIKSSKLHSLVVALRHLLLVLCHLAWCFVSKLVQAIQVDSQLIVITTFMESFSSQAGDSYFNWNYCFDAISETEGGLSCWGSCRNPVWPQKIGQLFRPRTLYFIQPSLDDLE